MSNKPFLLFSGPVTTRSGYGSHARDILKTLYDSNKYNIKIHSTSWGITPQTALNKNNTFHKWIIDSTITTIDTKPDIFIQVTIPNEATKVGNWNCLITAGIETTIAPKNWIDGCNNTDYVITTSEFSAEVLKTSVYNEIDKLTGKIINRVKVDTPISVLFEGIDCDIFNNKTNETELTQLLEKINSNFCFLFVGQWLNGDIGQDRKDVGMLIKVFAETFKNIENPPALVLKTSLATLSVTERETLITRIKNIIENIENPPEIYLLHCELTDEQMNELYNHNKIKSMVSLTKGEGFGRPLLEFSMSGKPLIASNWSGQKDFLDLEHSIMIGGSLNNVHKSSSNDYLLEEAKWFTANYSEASEALKLVYNDYNMFLDKAEELREINKEKFTLEKMGERLISIIDSNIKPIKKEIILPKLKKL